MALESTPRKGLKHRQKTERMQCHPMTCEVVVSVSFGNLSTPNTLLWIACSCSFPTSAPQKFFFKLKQIDAAPRYAAQPFHATVSVSLSYHCR